MRRRDFIRAALGLATAPAVAAVAVARPMRDTAMAENFRRTYGPKGWGKTRFAQVDYSRFEVQMIAAMQAQRKFNAEIIPLMEKNGFRYVGHIHDSFEFEMLKGARS